MKFDWCNLDPSLPLIGVDEVGRGCLAGPVCAGAVVINQANPWRHYTDSKKLSASRREQYAKQIYQDHFVSLGFASVDEISEINILQASLLAMKRAVIDLAEKMGISEAHLLIDGNQTIPGLESDKRYKFRQTTLVQGDSRAEPVGAASIFAKVARDRLLVEFASQYPGYGFEDHKGYATAAHRESIARLGPCSIHRRTFAGVREYWTDSAP